MVREYERCVVQRRAPVWRVVRKLKRVASMAGMPCSHSVPASVSSAAAGPVRATSRRSAPNTVLVPDPYQRFASSTIATVVVVEQSTESLALMHAAGTGVDSLAGPMIWFPRPLVWSLLALSAKVRFHAWTGEPSPLEVADAPAPWLVATGRSRFGGGVWARPVAGCGAAEFGGRVRESGGSGSPSRKGRGSYRCPVGGSLADSERARFLFK